MKFYVCVRRTIDWGNMTMKSFEDFIRNQGYLETDKRVVSYWGKDPYDSFLERIKWWNNCFDLSFFEYRQKLKDIAHINWSDMRGFEIIDGDDLADLNGDFLVVPTDDDDWLHPDLADYLQNDNCYWGLVLGGCWYGKRNDTRSFPAEEITNIGMGHNHCLKNFKDTRKIWTTVPLIRNMNPKRIDGIYSYSVISPVSLSNFVDMHHPSDMFKLFDYYMSGEHSAPDHSLCANKYLNMIKEVDESVSPRKLMV